MLIFISNQLPLTLAKAGKTFGIFPVASSVGSGVISPGFKFLNLITNPLLMQCKCHFPCQEAALATTGYQWHYFPLNPNLRIIREGWMEAQKWELSTCCWFSTPTFSSEDASGQSSRFGLALRAKLRAAASRFRRTRIAGLS